MQEKAILVCALADQAEMVAGTRFDHVCADCQRRVQVAPSGQKLLRQEPDTRIVCFVCAFLVMLKQQKFVIAVPEGAAQELNTVVPNFWKERN